MPPSFRTTFLSFAEGGRARPLLGQASQLGFEAVALHSNAPPFWKAAREVADHLLRLRADVLCSSGYKPDVIGWLAARRVGVPVIAVAHGWTRATLKVRVNEMLDRLVTRRMDAVAGWPPLATPRPWPAASARCSSSPRNAACWGGAAGSACRSTSPSRSRPNSSSGCFSVCVRQGNAPPAAQPSRL